MRRCYDAACNTEDGQRELGFLEISKHLAQFPTLSAAVRGGDLPAVHSHLAIGAFVDDSEDMMTPLHIAADNGFSEVAALLIDCHAELNKRAKNGETALILAAARGHARVVQVLRDAGADITLRMSNGKSAADVAWTAQHAHVCEILENPEEILTRRELLQKNLNSQLVMSSQRGDLGHVQRLLTTKVRTQILPRYSTTKPHGTSIHCPQAKTMFNRP